MISYRFVVFGFFLYFSMIQSWAVKTVLPKFTVYAYIPWKIKANLQNYRSESELEGYFLTMGIQPVKVIYENKYFTHGEIDQNKIKNLALKTALEPNVPVSFDMEFGNRFKPETVIPNIKAILNLYRSYNSKSLVGLYAILPQNTYGLKPTGYSYDKLNSKYLSLINDVDFISPSLYNYGGFDFDSWLHNAIFTLKAAKKLTSSKPIIPYISPIVRLGPSKQAKNGNLVVELSEEEMTKRLNALYKLGASGCIIWASSQDRKHDGQIPQFNPNRGWGKAVVQFIKSQQGDSLTY